MSNKTTKLTQSEPMSMINAVINIIGASLTHPGKPIEIDKATGKVTVIGPIEMDTATEDTPVIGDGELGDSIIHRALGETPLEEEKQEHQSP